MFRSKKIRILFISKEGRGGIETFLNQMELLDPKKYKIRFAYFKKDRFTKKRKNSIYLGRTYPKEVRFSLRKLFYFFENIIKTFKLIKEENPEIIFAVDIYSLMLLSVIRKFISKKITYIALVNTNIFYIFSKLRPNRFYRFFLINFFRLFSNSPDMYVFTSSALLDDITKNLNIPKYKSIVIPHSVDLTLLRKLKIEKLDAGDRNLFLKKGINLFSVGRLEDQKDFATILKAFEIVTKKNPDCRLFIIGDGKLKGELVGLAQKLEIDKKVYFLGWKKNIYKYLKHADVFLFSSFYEGFAMVVVEAMALGIPVVATDSPCGPGEILEGGKYGSLVKVGDAKKMASETILILSNKKLRSELSKKGLVRVKKYDTKLMLLEYDKLFSGI